MQKKTTFYSILTAFLLSLSIQAQAAPVALSNEPVLDSAAVNPNIILLIDSSGSMSEELPNTNTTRMQAAKQAAISLVNSLDNVNIGLAKLNGNDGARILVDVRDISINRNQIIQQINSISASGNTPLAEALQQLGRYYVQGYNNTLTLHPGQSNQTTLPAYTVFDKLPAFGSSINFTSPIQYYCQKSFIILLTDGEPTEDRDINLSTGLTDYDGDCAVSGVCTTYDRKLSYCAANYYNDNFCMDSFLFNRESSDYVDDVAAALFDIDLRPDLTAPAGVTKKNNVAVYPVGFASSNLQNNPLMQDIANNGGGVYLYANDAAALVQSFEAAAAAILSHISTAASVAFNTPKLNQGSYIYQVEYNTDDWSGNVVKRPLDANTGEVGAPVWNAATRLNNITPNSRVIFTYNPTTLQAIPFRTLSDLSLTQQADLKQGPTSVDTRGQQRLNYIRGDRSLEGSVFRTRGSVLGDIIDSAVVYLAEPTSQWPDAVPFPTGGNAYSVFKNAQKNRTAIVYAGANDGMLHGFNADTGNEVMAYIPSNLFSNASQSGLHYLTDINYEHRFYVDLTPTIEDAYVKVTPTGSAAWRSILVGGERNGGNGYFALDVTNPSNFSESNANNLLLWEFNSNNDSRLGRSYSQPVIGLLNNGRWAAIFGNGYNAPGTTNAALFIVYLDGGLAGTWIEGTDYLVLDTKKGNLAKPNGMASPAAVDLDGNQTIDRVYAGDYYGNMWAFDLSSSTASNWKIAYGTTSNPSPLFSAPTLQQPITSKPTVAKNTSVQDTSSNQPNVLVMFGTGQLLSGIDKLDTLTQSFYGVWDHGVDNLQQNNLTLQTFTTTNGQRVLSDTAMTFTASTSGLTSDGWYINFTNGERIITTPSVRGDTVFFNTVIPNNTSACSFGGSGWLMSVDITNGGQPSDVVFDVNNDDQLNDNDRLNGNVVSGLLYQSGVPTGSSFLYDMMYTATSSGAIEKRMVIDVGVPEGKISWHELTKN